MNPKNLTAILALLTFVSSGLVLAEESVKHDKYNHHHMSKRPHKKTAVKKPPVKDSKELQTDESLSDEESTDDIHHENHKKVRSNKLGRRPHMEHSTDKQ
jgi:hypothetical protein